jgi:hypothetical protein
MLVAFTLHTYKYKWIQQLPASTTVAECCSDHVTSFLLSSSVADCSAVFGVSRTYALICSSSLTIVTHPTLLPGCTS